MITNDCIILYVEDDEDIAELNIRWFDEQGYEMVYARTGAEAIGAFGKVAPDIVLLDIMLPGQDGLSLLEDLHRAGQTILLITHNPTVAARAERRLTLQGGKIVEEG